MSTQFNEFSVRPPQESDIPAIVDLLNASSLEIAGTQEASIEDYMRTWRSPGYDAAQDSRIAITAEGQIVAATHAYARTPYVSNFLWTAVHPAYWGRGLGTRLTQWGEDRVREHIANAPPDARVTVHSSALSTHQPAAEVLRNSGYQHVRSSYMMVIEMDAPPSAPIWPPGIRIQSMASGQEEAVYRAKQEAFKDHWGYVDAPFEEIFQRWQYYVTSHPHYDPSVFFLAMNSAEIAGVALCFLKDNEFPDMAWVDDLGVRRPWRRQGLALALLHHAFGEFYRRGIKKVGLGVDASSLTGATRLYEKAGMHIFRQYDTYEKELRPGRDLTTQTITEE